MVRICMITLFLLATQLHWSFTHGSSDTVRKAYIVYMGEAPQSKASATDLHHNLLSSVVKDKMQKLHTTRSWDFLGMPQSARRNHQIENNIIVGVLDTGIYIDAPSFDDKGFGPPPSKWKGARFYNHASTTPHPNPSPIDEDGHGSHTSSTIAGASIEGASLYSLAKGTARGGVPSARIAMYKVCWADGCSDIDLMAGLDDAINDGVDLISISIGGDSTSYFDNPIAIGAFHAMKKGILTTCSAGNNGPTLYSVQNTAPWILTVGASGMDRQFRTLVKLGNGIKTAPDIVAPGIDILLLTQNFRQFLGILKTTGIDVYNIISGTSMACPHVAAAAAYVKSFHPNWSPAAIKSALMTTTSELKIKDVQAELAYGAGQIDPVRALHPGLIYDMSKSDYIRFLCNEGYSGTALKVLTEGKTNCSSIPDIGGHDALNYPSMYLQLNSANSSISAIFHRTVTNVGLEKAIYKAVVKAPATLKVTVVPKELAFSHLYEKKSFMVVIKGPPLNNISSLSASLEWNDAKHRVKSPIHIFLGI
ncbi:subtilisin-like protease sbt4.15 [Quercus suber]|uniref:Subtilisin-like protease sbt4.15 n=1 Tax=Quercus suber TaxID=58331 RepID=A0AAW0J730_QUESU